MAEHRGWALDIYANEERGVTVWLLGENGVRHRLYQPFPVTFYASGPFPRLRALWRHLSKEGLAIHLERTRRENLFSGPLDVLAIQVNSATAQPNLFQDILQHFPDLDYYDADIPVALRYSAAHEIFPLAYCQVVTSSDGQIEDIRPLDSPWDLDRTAPPIRTLSMEPDVDPFHKQPSFLTVRYKNATYRLGLRHVRPLLVNLAAILRRHDPDLILTRWGDTWILPHLLELSKKYGIPFNPNRDPCQDVLRRQAHSYFTYGQVVYRGQQVHLFGRWHIDQHNAMMFGEYGLEGVFEQARVTGLPVQEIARKSPGSGITAMQMRTALSKGILIPYQKQQSERFKSALDLIRADRGGMVYQPLTGLHKDVAEIDFISMYPSIMVRFNISPETVGISGGNPQPIPELGVFVDQTCTGLVPETLRPLLKKRAAIKVRLTELSRHDCSYRLLQARAAALKWLLVVCFGYLGYKNARFGRIESHEAVTAFGREILLRAKEAAEKLGFTVLHMYVDALWVKRSGCKTVADFQPLLNAIADCTGLSISLDGIYRWAAFLPSRLDSRVPVANRYFGVFQDGSLKVRGLELRRRDTPAFIAQVQMEILQLLVRAPADRILEESLPDVIGLLRRKLGDLRMGRIALEQLLVSQTLSRTLDTYRVPSPAARAALQLQAMGKEMHPGQRIRFLYTRGDPGVYAWDLPSSPNPATLDVARYTKLLLRATNTVLQTLGVDQDTLQDWVLHPWWPMSQDNTRSCTRREGSAPVRGLPRVAERLPLPSDNAGWVYAGEMSCR